MNTHAAVHMYIQMKANTTQTGDESGMGDYSCVRKDEIEGLKKRLDDRLAPPTDSRQFNSSHGVDNEWEIGDCLAQWWRPNFETFMVCLFAT